MKVLWGAFFFWNIVILYLVLTGVIGSRGGGIENVYPYYVGISVVNFVLAFVLPKFILNVQFKRKLKPEQLAASYISPLVIRLALLESIVIFGVLSAITLGKSPLPFASAALLGMLYFYPSESKIMSELAPGLGSKLNT